MKSTKLDSMASCSKTPPSSFQEIACTTDLIAEILVRLPIKSLIRFKLVSKQWLSLISDPKFSLRRTPSFSPPSALFLQLTLQNGEFAFVDLNPNPSPPSSRSIALGDTSGIGIEQSCNGLFLCANETRENYFVYNPTTKLYASLPLPPHSTTTTTTTISSITLAFDPSKSPHFKAICVWYSTSDETRYWIEIYSSETGSWRPSRLGFIDTDPNLFSRGVFWNGCVHWFDPWGSSFYFNVDEECLHKMPMPPVSAAQEEMMEENCCYFGESGGHLHFVNGFFDPDKSSLNVYELERDYSRWFVKYVVEFSEIFKAFPEMNPYFDPYTDDQLALPEYCAMSVLCVVQCASDDESFLVMCIPGKLLRYNFANGTFCKIFDDPGKHGLFLLSDQASQYIESLAHV